MADLAMSAAGSNGAGNLPAPRRPGNAPTPTGSPSGIRGPRMIMQERAAREARQRAEAEKQQMERARAEQEARLQEEALRNAAERRSAGAAAGSAAEQQQFIASNPQRSSGATQQPTTSVPAAQASHHRTNSSRYSANQQLPSQIYAGQPQQQPLQQIPTQPQTQQQLPPQQQQQQQQQPQPSSQQRQSTTMPVRTSGEAPSQPAQATAGTAASSKPRNSFPHAFERWETLSAHWEGLTSYWIRKLEQNKDDLSRDPVSQQLARQVTDLSAAGANLFHAVVELQRLRASSERKFQRWFFETRGELERAQEVNTMLENALDQERRNRDEAIREVLDKDQGSTQAQKQLAEMRKELAISKDEARRAWEELGRREQAERDRTLSLQSGNPTIVGGVQVVPMTQGAAASARHHAPVRDTGAHREGYGQGYAADLQPPRSAHASPSQGRAPAAAGASGSPTHYGQPAGAPASPSPYGGRGEYVTDVQGNLVLDARGNRIPVMLQQPASSYSGSDAGVIEEGEYDTPATTNPPSGTYDPPTAAPQQQQQQQHGSPGSGPAEWTGAYSDAHHYDDEGEEQDYSGEGYATPTWEEQPRHHHPTRLSDVIEEEDERSRTSASQLSRH